MYPWILLLGAFRLVIYMSSVKCLPNEKLPVRGSKDVMASPNFINLCNGIIVGKQPSLEEHRKVEIQCHEFVVLEWQIAYSPTDRTQDCRNSNKVIHCKQTSKIPHKTPQSSHTPRLLKLHLEMRHIRITTASAKCRRDLRHTSIVTAHSKHFLTLKATPVGFILDTIFED